MTFIDQLYVNLIQFYRDFFCQGLIRFSSILGPSRSPFLLVDFSCCFQIFWSAPFGSVIHFL
jgi:hypothetical protein